LRQGIKTWRIFVFFNLKNLFYGIFLVSLHKIWIQKEIYLSLARKPHPSGMG
jgi:hypothetical protein